MTYTPEQISQIVLKVLKEIETPDVSKLSCDEKLKLAQNPNTSPETLNVLATDKNSNIRRLVAEHPNTSQETLAVLATDKYWGVRWEVARHPNTSLIVGLVIVIQHILNGNLKPFVMIMV